MGLETNKTSFLMTLKKISKVQELGVVSALLVIVILLGSTTENFLTVNNVISIFRSSTYIGIMSLGMVFVLTARDVDISVGGIYNLSGLITAFMLAVGLPVILAILIGILVGVACGLFNFGLSAAFKIPTIIITKEHPNT